MRVFQENFDCFVFFEACYGAPQITGNTITIPVINLPVLNSHPIFGDRAIRQHPALGKVVDGFMIFRGVVLSRREIAEYDGGPKSTDCKFKDVYIIEDINTHSTDETLNRYEFEGVSFDPSAWIGEWLVIARSFELQVE